MAVIKKLEREHKAVHIRLLDPPCDLDALLGVSVVNEKLAGIYEHVR